jgi:DNA-binding CsgD family transcriptional regulator
LLFLLIVLGLQIWGIRSTRKKERLRLEKREQELIKLRNEKLRNEIEHKSKELANSTMSIIKKNEFLLKLKQTLSKHKDQLGSRYPDKYYMSLTKKIDENISSQDDWHLFESNFERAHDQFLNNLKGQFPDLTPKDLRLCAFLRMNLSSKEIAPLLGISVRGIENHRYRLRKKMGLDHDDNLIDMILKL